MREKIKEGVVGQAVIRLYKESGIFKGVVVLGDKVEAREEGSNADEVWRLLHDAAAKLSPQFFGYEGARNRFLHFFPEGFGSSEYARRERDYKLNAKKKLDVDAPLDAAMQRKGLAEAILAAFRATNLLYPVEKSRMQEVLRGPTANDFIHGAAVFASGDIRTGLIEMQRVLKPYDIAKWIVVTYLPFLWRPESHMFLKPQVTLDFSTRVGHSFASHYSAKLEVSVYQRLLDLGAEVKDRTSDLNPKDNIDVQSFIWVVGHYVEKDKSVVIDGDAG